MYKSSPFIRMLLPVFLFLLAGTAWFTEASFAQAGLQANSRLDVLPEKPVLSVKNSQISGDRVRLVLNITILNDAAVKALEEIRDINKPGSYVAYAFTQFSIDRSAKTLLVETAKANFNQQELLNYLQNSLDNGLKPVY